MELSAWSARGPEGPGRPAVPERIPGSLGDPSRRAGSQGAAQQETLPLLGRPVHAGGPDATSDTSAACRRPASGATGSCAGH